MFHLAGFKSTPRPGGPQCRRGEQGFTLVETGVAALMVATAIGALFIGNTRVLEMLRFQKETLAATQSFQERMEQIRSLSFSNIADATYLQTSVMNTDTQSEAIINGETETITVSVYPDDGSTPTVLTRTAGAVTVNSTNTNLTNGSLIRVDIQLTWTSMDGRSRLRRTSTVIGKGNIGP